LELVALAHAVSTKEALMVLKMLMILIKIAVKGKKVL
jgi:hypothetical protein